MRADLSCSFAPGSTTAWSCTEPSTTAGPRPVIVVQGDHSLTPTQTIWFTALLMVVVLAALFVGSRLRKV